MTDRTRPTPPEEPEFLRNQMALLAVSLQLGRAGVSISASWPWSRRRT
jgi:hypothetical protein